MMTFEFAGRVTFWPADGTLPCDFAGRHSTSQGRWTARRGHGSSQKKSHAPAQATHAPGGRLVPRPQPGRLVRAVRARHRSQAGTVVGPEDRHEVGRGRERQGGGRRVARARERRQEEGAETGDCSREDRHGS